MIDRDGVPIPVAAQRLGLTIDGVRKRLQRGTLQSYKQSGRVMVLLPSPIDQPGNGLAPVEQEMSPELVDVAQNVQVLIEMVRDQARQIGSLEAQLTEARQEVRALRKTVLMLARERAGADG